MSPQKKGVTRNILTGRKFGRLTVGALSHFQGSRAHWHVVCDCGKVKTAHGGDMIAGKINSCGCARDEKRGLKHGQRWTPTYSTWCAMKGRCGNPANISYADYGARGIVFCERWQSFANFLKDMGERPAGMSLDRIDNSGNYEPSNCRWATQKEQMSNTRVNVRLTRNGETLTIHEWARRTGIEHSTIRKRVAAGWSLEDTFRKPSKFPRGA